MIRAFENEKKREPYQRLGEKITKIMHTSTFDNEELLKTLREELTFTKFLEMKSHWLKNIRTEWLIMGHLEEKDAIDIVKRGEKNLVCNKIGQD